MKAAVIHEFGDFDVLKHEEVATPRPKPGNVLVKVLAAGVNRLDHYLREGSVVPELPFPHVFGADAAGEVAELGPGTTTLHVGDRVIPNPGFPLDEKDYGVYPLGAAPSFTLPGLGVWGSYAQFMEAPARWVTKDDTGLAPEEVATLPMALATAVRAVKEVGGRQARRQGAGPGGRFRLGKHANPSGQGPWGGSRHNRPKRRQGRVREGRSERTLSSTAAKGTS